MSENNSLSPTSLLTKKIIFASLVAVVALTIPLFIIQKSGVLAETPLYQHLLQSIVVGFVAVFGIWLLLKNLNGKPSVYIGLAKPSKAIVQFLFGFGLIAVPLSITLLISLVFGWGEASFNISNGLLWAFIIGMVSTFLTDALTEELIFRGYIYSNLKKRFNVWISSLITLGLFVILPVVVILIQKLLGLEISIGGNSAITGAYIFTLIAFGAFVQYLRIITNSIWAAIGFHTFFVHMNQLMGITDDRIIQFSESSNEQALQITLMILLLIVSVGLIAYPFIKRKKMKRDLAE